MSVFPLPSIPNSKFRPSTFNATGHRPSKGRDKVGNQYPQSPYIATLSYKKGRFVPFCVPCTPAIRIVHGRQLPSWSPVCTKIKNPWQTLSRVFPRGAKYFSPPLPVFFRSPLEFKEFQRVQGYGMVKKKRHRRAAPRIFVEIFLLEFGVCLGFWGLCHAKSGS